MPGEAALCDAQLTTQPVDLQGFHAFGGQDRITGLNPAVHRQSVADGAASTGHDRLPTAVLATSADARVIIRLGRQTVAWAFSLHSRHVLLPLQLNSLVHPRLGGRGHRYRPYGRFGRSIDRGETSNAATAN